MKKVLLLFEIWVLFFAKVRRYKTSSYLLRPYEECVPITPHPLRRDTAQNRLPPLIGKGNNNRKETGKCLLHMALLF